MSIKSRFESTAPSQPSPDAPSDAVVDRAEAPEDKASGSDDETVDFSSGKIVTAIGYLMCLVILAANIYVLVTL